MGFLLFCLQMSVNMSIFAPNFQRRRFVLFLLYYVKKFVK